MIVRLELVPVINHQTIRQTHAGLYYSGSSDSPNRITSL